MSETTRTIFYKWGMEKYIYIESIYKPLRWSEQAGMLAKDITLEFNSR